MIEKNDLIILKAFRNQKEPKFVSVLNLHYEMDYFYGITSQILSKKKRLQGKLSDFSIYTKNEIIEYLQKYGTDNDKIFFFLLETVNSIFYKYYDENGIYKENV